jgi:hypothetical protein
MRRCRLLALPVSLLTCLATAVLAADIQLFNGDFEQEGLTAERVPVGWHTDTPGVKPSINVQATRLRTHDGQGAVRIWDDDARGYVLESRFYPAVAGQTYKASAWVLNLLGDGWLYVEFYANHTTRISEKHIGGAAVGEWGQLAVEEVCPPEARYVAVLLYSSGSNQGEAAWDGVTLTGPAGEGEILNLDKTQEAARMTYDPGLTNVGDQKQLLFDNAFFESHKGFWWRVCPPRKTGERNVVADKPWEDFIINAWQTVMEDEGRYRMWYEAYDKTGASDDQARYCYAESTDGIQWTKPVLGLDSFADSKENNILFNRLGGCANHGGTVFKDPAAPPAERYKFIYLSCDAKRENWGVYGGYSPDGLRWQRYENGPILKVGSDTQTACFWDETLKKYVAYCRLWTHNRTVGRSESASFLDFPMAGEVLGCDEQDPPDTDMYNNAVVKYPYAANAYFIFTSTYHHTADNLDVQLAVSRDGVNWSRPERRPFIANGEPGSFDDATIYCGVGLIRKGDELWMYYHGSRARHNQVYANLISSEGVYSRAVLVLDRYVALDAAMMPAEFVTKPLTFTGSKLEINAAVRPQGDVRFELQDAAGVVLPGYALEDCQPLQGDSPRHAVSWKNGADLALLAGTPTRLRCVARDASLFAFQFVK